jgi:hypothetical protein
VRAGDRNNVDFLKQATKMPVSGFQAFGDYHENKSSEGSEIFETGHNNGRLYLLGFCRRT